MSYESYKWQQKDHTEKEYSFGYGGDRKDRRKRKLIIKKFSLNFYLSYRLWWNSQTDDQKWSIYRKSTYLLKEMDFDSFVAKIKIEFPGDKQYIREEKLKLLL